MQTLQAPLRVGANGYPGCVVTALYRRYRPDTFADLIGQEQVTGPLMAALRNNRVNHAYLFSGPRGCGKTTSARILARCLNCTEGPTDTPCGNCPSCRELATGGQGSLDVIEIDAASHGGVDDARELRERAVFAPARDRYKIFIIDEAHMVTPGGFNALLKLVEEPPDHVKFIFATTEPEKVIGTIRSRTHRYPFRLIPPAVMLPYLDKVLAQEGVEAEPGVLPTVVRAGGGSVRDTLSVLDQLIAGTDSGAIRYDTTIGLLGYTPAKVLAEVMTALSAQDAPALFAAVDKVVQGGQDPRRFAEDLLQRLRDAAVATLTGPDATKLLRELSADEIETLQREGRLLGQSGLDRAAHIVDETLNSMGGTTNPRTQVELMCARLLLPEADWTISGASARIDRLERRLDIAPGPMSADRNDAAAASFAPEPLSAERGGASAPEQPPRPQAAADPTPPPLGSPNAEAVAAAWPQVLAAAERRSRVAWVVIKEIRVAGLHDDVLALQFDNATDEQTFRGSGAPSKAAEVLRAAIEEVLGVRLRFVAHSTPRSPTAPPQAAPPDDAPPDPGRAPVRQHEQVPAQSTSEAAAPSAPTSSPSAEPAPAGDAWPEESAVAAGRDVPDGDPESPDRSAPPSPDGPDAAKQHSAGGDESRHRPKYGEAVIRELLDAKPREQEE